MMQKKRLLAFWLLSVSVWDVLLWSIVLSATDLLRKSLLRISSRSSLDARSNALSTRFLG